MKTVLLMLVLSLSANAVGGAQVGRLPANARAEFEATRNRAIIPSGFEFVVPQLIIGGEWTSTLKLINRGTEAIPVTQVFFFDDTGEFMEVTYQTTGGELVTDIGFTFQLGADVGMLELTFFGDETVTQFGHAQIEPGTCSQGAACTLYGEVTLRNRNATRPDFESVFPLEEPAPEQYLLWDHRNGYSSTLYLVNADLSPVDVVMEFRDYDDVLIDTVSGRMAPASAQILVPHAIVPETIGKQGSITIRGTSADSDFPYIVATGLRINPTNSFTPIRAFTEKF